MDYPCARSLLLAALIVAARPLYAQTASGARSLTKKPEVDAKTVSAANPWVAGAQLGYKFVGEGDFADNVFAAGTIIYNVPLDTIVSHGWFVPVFSNLASMAADAGGKSSKDSLEQASNALLNSAQGILVKIAPYNTFHPGTNLRMRVLTEFGGKINSLAAKDTAEGKETMLQGRLAAGLEIELGKKADKDGNNPITFSVTGIKSYFSATSYEKVFGERKSNLTAIELTGIIPIKIGTGLISEAVLAKNHAPAIRVGILLAREGN